MYYLAEHRGLREPVVVSVNNTSMAARLGEHYGIDVHETPVGFKYIGPKMIETGAMMGAEESGGFGFGMHLPERDGDLRRPDAARPVPAREGRRPLAGLEGDRPLPRDRRARRSTAGSTSTSTARRVRRDEAPAARRPRRERRRPSSPASRSSRTQALDTNDGFKFFVADGSWLLIRTSAAPSRSSGSTRRPRPRLRGSDARRPASGWSAARELAVARARPDGRQAVGPRADLGADRPLLRQDHRDRDRPAAVAPVPRAEGRVDLRPVAAGCCSTSRTTPGRRDDPRAGAGRRRPRPGRSHATATRRSSGSS